MKFQARHAEFISASQKLQQIPKQVRNDVVSVED